MATAVTPDPLPDLTNLLAVGVRGDKIVVAAPRMHMTRDEATVHAAWLLIQAQPDILDADGIRRFLAILEGVANI